MLIKVSSKRKTIPTSPNNNQFIFACYHAAVVVKHKWIFRIRYLHKLQKLTLILLRYADMLLIQIVSTFNLIVVFWVGHKVTFFHVMKNIIYFNKFCFNLQFDYTF